jgi:signal transduction histidine kinase
VERKGDEIEKLATTFNKMLDRIQDLIAGIREMTDNIAHDLRSPIARIRGIAEVTLTTGKSIKDYEVMAASTIEESDRLLAMVNTMLDISEIEAGIGKIPMAMFDVTKMITRACELFQPIADNNHVDVILKMPHSCYLNGNIQMFQRIVANLIDNALKYTQPKGIVTISVNEDNQKVIISFKDTGPGISENDLKNIFRRFYRGDQSRAQEGTVLGLSMVRAVLNAHGGDIIVTSEPDKGSTFTVTMPSPHRPT